MKYKLLILILLLFATTGCVNVAKNNSKATPAVENNRGDVNIEGLKQEEGKMDENKIKNVPTEEKQEEITQGDVMNISNNNKINPECSGWYVTDGYRGKSSLKSLGKITTTKGARGYILYRDELISFYYPSNWTVNKTEDSDNNYSYNIYYLENTYATLKFSNIDSYKENYNTCLSKCFKNAGTDEARFYWESTYCSNDYSIENLEKFLSGNFAEFFSTGPLPPGGSGQLYYKKAYKNLLVSFFYTTEDFQFYPKAYKIRGERDYNELTNDELKIIQDEKDYYSNEFEKILKSVEIITIKK